MPKQNRLKLTDEQKNIIRELIKFKKDVQTLGGFAGTGKSQKLDSLVYTPFGPKRMGDIEVGDQISNPDGSVANVIGVFPQGELPVYKVSFIDGASTIVSGDHLWRVRISSKKYKAKKSMLDGTGDIKEEIATTDALRAYLEKNKTRSRPRYPLIPFAKPVQFTVVTKLLMDSYLLGLLLGDGGITESVKFTTEDDFICEQITSMLDDSYELHPIKNTEYDYNIVKKKRSKHPNLYIDALKHYGLFGKHSHEKFIPEVYKITPLKVRWALLQGLMDTDGTIEHENRLSNGASYCTTSNQLAKDVQWLVRSLGGKATISERTPTYTHNGEKKEGRLAYNLYIQVPEKSKLFRLPRKKELCVDKFNGGCSVLRNRMVSIEPAGVEMCQCIQVDNPNSLYITDDFIVTHNTTVIRHLTSLLPNFAVCAFTGKAADVLRKKDVQATTIHSLIYTPLTGDGGEIVKDKHGNPTFALADDLSYEGIIVDEASMVNQKLYKDLLSFGIPIIFVGDHGQLEPVGSDINVMENPDFRLETIHRNAGEIARFCEWIRMGYTPASFAQRYPTRKIQFVNRWQADRYLLGVDQIICAFNKTRVELNAKVRYGRGTQDPRPVVNDRVMCLKNNHKIGLFNGMQGDVSFLWPNENRMQFKTETKIFDIMFDPSQFGRVKYNLDDFHRDDPDPFDWAFAITAHKAQGDEWGNTMVHEQKCNKWDHKRWAYTAASRAMESIIWVVY